MSYCLCCNSSLLRHIRQGEVYLYCPDCRQEMPGTDSCIARQAYSVLNAAARKPLLFRRDNRVEDSPMVLQTPKTA